MTRPGAGSIVAALTIVFILLVTLVPQAEFAAEPTLACVNCGLRSLADALLNLILFFPLGASLGRRMSARRLLLGAALTSSLIELTQLLVPGRDASVGDVVLNVLGASLGMLAVRTVSRWSYPQSRVASRACLGAALFAVACFALTGYLLQPVLPPTTYFGQWTPRLGHLEWYGGKVIWARIGDLQLPPWQLDDPDRFRSLMMGGTALEVMTVAGPAPTALAPIFSVYGEGQQEVMILGADKDHLVFRYRTRAAVFHLDQPDLRLPRALADVPPGDTVGLSVQRVARGHVLTVDGRGARLGFSVGAGWALLLYPEWLSPGTMQLLSVLWMAVLVVPVGFWARRRWESVAGVAVVALAVIWIPPAVGLVTTPAMQWVGVTVGLTVGVLCQRRARKPVLNLTHADASRQISHAPQSDW